MRFRSLNPSAFKSAGEAPKGRALLQDVLGLDEFRYLLIVHCLYEALAIIPKYSVHQFGGSLVILRITFDAEHGLSTQDLSQSVSVAGEPALERVVDDDISRPTDHVSLDLVAQTRCLRSSRSLLRLRPQSLGRPVFSLAAFGLPEEPQRGAS